MKQELDEALVRDFPNLYRDRHGDKMSTCMCWGFPSGDGWEPLIRRLSEKLEPMIVAQRDDFGRRYDSSGGTEIIDVDLPCASQVKEKFGTLRFYMDGIQTDAMRVAIDEAETESETTCQVCGAPGILRTGGWLVTLCDTCHTTAPIRREHDELKMRFEFLQKRHDRALTLLSELEWINGACPKCRVLQYTEHTAECELGKRLKSR